MNNLSNKISEVASFLKTHSKGIKPKIGLILGSGLGHLADEISNATRIAYSDIPGFPVSTVQGHGGKLIFGKLEKKDILVMQGRFHYYEGYDLKDVTLPVRIMKKSGIETLIITNSAGGINKNFKPGDLMLITDHINMQSLNPLRGKNLDEYGIRFPDMSDCYNSSLRNLAKKVALSKNIELQEGVYLFGTGPNYETPAEVKMERILGADAVGMSTVPEVIIAVHSGMKVVGISCITNMASGILKKPLSHDEVMETTNAVKNKFITLIKGIVSELDN